MITLVLGGARSGKSRYAEGIAAATGKPKLYVATSEALDSEMQSRIARHKEDRKNNGWQTAEEPIFIGKILLDTHFSGRVILVDCLTLWLSNLMHYGMPIDTHGSQLLEALRQTHADVILVSNEVGMGIVPEHKMARDFRDASGILHQQVANIADRVVIMVAGLPMTLKA